VEAANAVGRGAQRAGLGRGDRLERRLERIATELDTPLGDVGQPDDVGNLCRFLIGPE